MTDYDYHPTIFIQIENSAGSVYGDGPILTATDWQQKARLNRAGAFSFNMPTSDPRSNLIKSKRIARAFYITGGQIIEIGVGIIDQIKIVVSLDGATMMQVSGDDLLRELTYTGVGFLELSDGAGGGSSTALADIMAFSYNGWSLSGAGYSSTGTTPYGRYAGESVLNALVKLAVQQGHNFRLGSDRQIVWLRADLPASGKRAIGSADPVAVEANDDVVLIANLSETETSYGLFTRLYVYGTGNGKVRLTLEKATLTFPGYIIQHDGKDWCLVNIAAETTYGRIETSRSFKNIGPVSHSDLDIQNAANALAEAAHQFLVRHSEPQTAYELSVTKLKDQLYPGETINVLWREIIDSYTAVNIDADLIILETSNTIDSQGVRTTDLLVSTIDQWPQSDTDIIAAQLEEARLMDAHPQLSITHSPVTGTERIDPTHPAEFEIRLKGEVAAVNHVLLWFKTVPLRSDVIGSAGGTSHTHTTIITSGGAHAHTTIITSGGVHVHWVSISLSGAHIHDIYVTGDPEWTQTTDTGSHTHGSFSSDTPAHTHGSFVSDAPAHIHGSFVSTEDTTHTHLPVYGLFEDSNYPQGISVSINGTNHTAALGGSWAASNEGVTVEVDISQYILTNTENKIRFTCTTGMGRIKFLADQMLTIQAISFS